MPEEGVCSELGSIYRCPSHYALWDTGLSPSVTSVLLCPRRGCAVSLDLFIGVQVIMLYGTLVCHPGILLSNSWGFEDQTIDPVRLTASIEPTLLFAVIAN
jgi:hypothetical protein